VKYVDIQGILLTPYRKPAFLIALKRQSHKKQTYCSNDTAEIEFPNGTFPHRQKADPFKQGHQRQNNKPGQQDLIVFLEFISAPPIPIDFSMAPIAKKGKP
jgi:hypothetical protein